jgi:hypothetical protein
MGINVAGTNALGGYLTSQIVNTRELIAGATGQPTTTAPATSLPATGPTTQDQLQAAVRAQNLADTQTLFGLSATPDAGTSELPAIPGQTAQQLTIVAIQSSQLALQFSTISTLFGSGGIGANTDTQA